MATDALNPIQLAVYTALSSDGTLMGKITGVYDFVPQDTAFPYVEIGDDTADDLGSHTFDGQESTLTIHTWSQKRGRKECKDIMSDLRRILHRASLSVSSHALVLIRNEFATTMRDEDAITIHGVQRFRILTREV